MSNLLRRPIFRHLWRSSGLLPLLALYVAVVTAITLVVSVFTDIERSAWGFAAQLTPWFMLGLGVYATAVYLPLYITHGHTRREFLFQSLMWVMLLAPTAAGLTTVMFGIERLVYRATGWTQAFDDEVDSLFTTPDQYGWIFVGFWLTFLSYLSIGAVLGAVFYRNAWHGLAGPLMIPVALVLAGPSALAAGSSIAWLPGFLGVDATAPLTIAMCLLAFTAAGTLTWAFARDIPVRSNVP